MSRIHAKAAQLYVDEFDFSGVSNAVDIDVTGNVGEVTAFADTDATYVEGKPGATVQVNGFFSTASPNYDGEMFTDLTAASRRLGVYPDGATSGEEGYEFITDITASPRIATTGGAALVNVTWQSTSPVAIGRLLDVDTAIGASGNGTAYLIDSVAATETVQGVLRLLAVPGGAGDNTLDVKIQCDDAEAFSHPTDVLTFTQLTQASVATFEVKASAGAIADSWWRVVYTYAGAGTRTFSLVISLTIRRT